jgi:ketosteroid isomerase-like protein
VRSQRLSFASGQVSQPCARECAPADVARGPPENEHSRAVQSRDCAGREGVNLHAVSTPSATVLHRSGLGLRLLQDRILLQGPALRIGNREGKIMAEHPNVARITDAYAAFAKGDLAVLEDFFAEDVLWHEGGRNQITGDYRGREAVFGLFGKLMEITEGSLRVDPHAVFADDEHGVALVVVTAKRLSRSSARNRG